MKKKILVLLAVVTLLFGCKNVKGESKYSKQALTNNKKGYTQEVISGKLIEFKDLEDLEGQTENIIRVRKIKELESVPWDGPDAADVEPGFESGTTMSEAEVLEVFKGSLQEGEKIRVEEDFFRNDVSKKIFSVEGYTAMNDGEEYLLLLNKNEDYYYIVGVLPGQIPLINPIKGNVVKGTNSSRNVAEEAGTSVIINTNFPEEIQNLQIQIVDKYIK